MTSTSTTDERQQPASKPSLGGSDDGQPVTIATILQRVQGRQEAVEHADDAVPLLGLEPADIDKAGENSPVEVEATRSPPLAPLLGTICSQSIENARGSSERRSPESVCYTEVSHIPVAELSRKRQKTVPNGLHGCYTKLLHKLPIGMSMRGSTFYYRRRLPTDVRRLTGKAEVWRSLRTDSLKVAMRRLPNVAFLACELRSR